MIVKKSMIASNRHKKDLKKQVKVICKIKKVLS